MRHTAQLKKILIVSLPCLLLMMLWVFIQTRIGIHADNVYFIQAAQRLLAGGSYLHGFFEPNPPLVILLNIPVIFLAKYTAFNSTDAFRFYVAILGLLSVGLSYNLLSRIIADTKSLVVMLSAITLVMFILPNVAFGERESLFFILSLPYVWMVLLRIENKPVAASQALIVGLMAGIGFCLKPYFFTLAFVLETWLLMHKKNRLAWLRTETVGIGLVALCYLGIVFLFFSDYVHAVVPILTKYYLITTWQTMFFDPVCAYIVTVLISAVILYKRIPYPHITKLLMLTIVALAAAYYFSRRPDYYHQLPMLSMTIILGCWCGWQVTRDLFGKSPPLALLTTQLLQWFLAVIVLFFIVPTGEVTPDSIPVMAVRFGIAMLSCLSITMVYQYTQRIFQEELLRFFVILAFIATLFFSATPYGQPEQLLVVLVVPFLFSFIFWLQDKTRSSAFGLITGVIFIAGVVYVLRGSSFNLAILKKYYIYSLAAKQPKNAVSFENINRIYCCFVAMMATMHFRKTLYKEAYGILLLSLLAFIGLAFLWQQSSYFGTIPALCVANLLAALLTGELLLTKPGLLQLSSVFVFAEKLLISVCASAVLFLGSVSFMFSEIDEAVYDNHNKKNSLLSAFFARHPNSTFDFFAENNTAVFVSIYTKAHFVGQFPMLWWIDRMNRQVADSNHHALQAQALRDEYRMVGMIAQSLTANKPQYMIVTIKHNTTCTVHLTDKGKIASAPDCKLVVDTDKSYIKLFSRYQAFREAWQPYKQVDTLDNFEIYQRG